MILHFAHILYIPDETLTIHHYDKPGISNCSAYVKFCSSSGISPTKGHLQEQSGSFSFPEIPYICNELLQPVLILAPLIL